MSVNGKFDGIARADLMVEASRFNVRAPGRLIADVAAALESWPQFAKTAGLDDKYGDAIATDFRVAVNAKIGPA